MPIVTLTTDYGMQDFYVAALKGVILEIAPEARIVDVTHDIEPHDVLRGAFVVRQAWPWFKEGTVHVAIIDPGVGSKRRVILGEYAGRYIVAPDNGLVTFIHRDFPRAALYAVQNTDFFLPVRSATFHGRDLMAPVAAHLAKGANAGDFGPAIDDPVLLPIEPEGKFTGKEIRGRVLYVDRFGTMIGSTIPLSGPCGELSRTLPRGNRWRWSAEPIWSKLPSTRDGRSIVLGHPIKCAYTWDRRIPPSHRSSP